MRCFLVDSEMKSITFSSTSQRQYRFLNSLQPCLLRSWKLPRDSWEIPFVSLSKETSSHLRVSSNSTLLREFCSGSSHVLITTNLLACGIDAQQVSLVINFDLPTNCEYYIHSIGCSGQFGHKGVAVNFLTESDICYLHNIEQFYTMEILEMPMNVTYLI